MTDIEFIVSFVAILIGLLLANVANNMADAVRARRDLPIGFVPWAISIYISAAAVSSYAIYHSSREGYKFDLLGLILALVTVLSYVFVSRLLYPEHKDRWASVEEYYLANRHLILGIMVVAPLTTILTFFYQVVDVPVLEVAAFMAVLYGLPALTMLLLMLTGKRQWHWAGWAFLIAHRSAVLAWLAITSG